VTGDKMPGRNQTPPLNPLPEPRTIDVVVGRVRGRLPNVPGRIRAVSGRSRRLDSTLADLPWRMVIGLLLTALPISLLALIAGGWTVSMASIVALAMIALSAYLADWVGGISALTIAFLLLDLFFVDQRTGFARPVQREDRLSLLTFTLTAVLIIWLVQRVKAEGTEDRQSAIAARSAATALSAIETIAGTQQRLSFQERKQIYDAIVHNVVGLNRAHAGALMLSVPGTDDFLPDASYGFGPDAQEILRLEGAGAGIIHRIGIERRPLQVYDLRGSATSELRTSPVRSLLGAPIISPDDRVLGVLLIGLLVPHRYSNAEVKKLEAYALQIAGILETMSATGEREFELQQARDEQRRLERVIAAIPEAVVVVAPDHSVVATNAVAEELFCTGIDRDFSKRLLAPDGESIDEDELPIQRAMEAGEPIEGIELAIDRGGHLRPLLASAAPILDQNGKVTAVVGAFRDITTLKEAARIKDEFVSVVSHELRSPLTPIRGYVQLVARELAREGGHELQVKRLNSIDGHVVRLARLVDDLLDVSRLRAGSLEIRPLPSDLVELTRDVIQVRSIGESSDRIQLVTKHESIRGEWDPDRIQQVIDNLVGNALKYSPPTGQVTVTVDVVADRAAISVADEGPGISEVDRQNIFGAFFRTSDATSSQAPGLGLGLYICRELVRAHDGTIEVVEAPGGGAEFRVLLPMTEASEAVATPVQLELTPQLMESDAGADISAGS
jgi:PAS domain S-box-containing protein